MNKTILVLLSLFLLAFGEGSSPLSAITSTITDLTSAVGSLGPVLQMFKRDSTIKMGDLKNQEGFTNLQSHTDYDTRAVKESQLKQLFRYWVSGFPVKHEARAKLIDFIKESKFQVFIEPHQRHIQDFKFSDAKGKLCYVKVLLQQHPTMPDVIRWEKMMWTANFQVAQPFMVVTKSKCGFLGCKTKDSVQYFQATLTPDHINAVKSLALPFVSISNPQGQTILEGSQA